jgi:plastocyanin
MSSMGPRRATTLTALAAAVATAAVLAACGADPPYTPAAGHTVRLRLDEYRVLPQRVTVPAGRIEIVARDTGRLTHNVAVVQFDRPLGDDEEKQYARTPTAHPGDVVRTSVTLKPGKYRLVCTIANHDNLGQYGELKVEAPR